MRYLRMHSLRCLHTRASPHVSTSRCRSTRRQPPRRWRRCRADSKVSEEQRLQQEKQLEEVLKTRVEQAAKLLDDIIDDIVCDLSTVQSIGYIYDEVPAETEREIVKKVVKRYLDQLDQNFLASLEPFQQKSKNLGNPEVARLIAKIHEEVLSQTNEQFPPEVLLLEDLMKLQEKKDRIEKMKQVAEAPDPKPQSQESPPTAEDIGGDLDLPIDVPEDLPLEEMDLKAELKRLKVLKSESGLKSLKEELEREWENPVVSEEASDFDEVMESADDLLEDCQPDVQDDDRQGYGKKITPLEVELAANQFITDIEEKEEVANRQLLAKLCVIREEARLLDMEMKFSGASRQEHPLKMRENVPSQVMGIIQMLIKTSDPIKRVGLLRKTFEKDEYAPAVKDLNMAPGYVRPGIFMTALTMTQMEADSRSKFKSTASQISSDLLQRIDDIRLEAMLVLRGMGWGEYTSDELAKRQKEREERQKKIKEEYFPKKNT